MTKTSFLKKYYIPRTQKIRRKMPSVSLQFINLNPHVSRKLQTCNDVELNPGPRPVVEKKNKINTESTPIHNNPRVERLEHELANVQTLLSSLDTSMSTLMDTMETMKPAYLHAMRLLNTANPASTEQKNNLVFYGLAPEPLEVQMEKEPEFCRDILETRVKLVFREYLKITRDIPFTSVYRFTTANADPDEIRPIVAGFRSIRDKENILRHASSSRILKQKGIYVTEDFSSKKQLDKPARPIPDQALKLIETHQLQQGGKNNFEEGQEGEDLEDVADEDEDINGRSDGPGNAANTLQAGADVRYNLQSSAGMSDRMSSCNSDYAPSSNSGNSSSGAFTDD